MGFGVKQQETKCDQAPACGPAHWAGPDPEAALIALGASRAGLNKAEVAERLARYGHNTLPRLQRRPWYLELAANFIHLFALLLWAAAGLAWIAGMPQLAWAIVAVILINGLFSFWQEYQAERAAEALEALLPREVTVRRDGQPQLVPTSEIAPGDLLLLSEGEATPADARLISAAGVRLDVSSLTGESRPIPRTVESIDSAPDAVAATLSNLVFAGTTVASGHGEAVVFATGANTEFGRIAQLTQSQDERTLALALGVKRMARRRALVKRLSSVETLGATTVILTDKTGTLTENEMTARELWAGGASYQLSGTGYDPGGELAHKDGAENDPAAITEMLRAAALCCDAHLVPPNNDQWRWTAIGDPTEAAILAAAAKLGLSREKLSAWPRLAELPFDSSRKRMTTIQRIDGAAVACVKGAPGEIFSRCVAILLRGGAEPFDGELRRRAEVAHEAMARRGLRVLAVATRGVDPNSESNDGWRMEDVERDLTLLGLIAMEDPPRPEVASAIAACRQAGVRVVMVTGDHGLTAAAIGREIGLSDGGDAPPPAFTARTIAQLANTAARLRLARNDRGRSFIRRLLLRLLARGLASGRPTGRERSCLFDGDNDVAGRHCGLPDRQCLRMPQRPSGELAARFRKQSPAAHWDSSGGGVVAPASLRAATANGVRPGAAGYRALVVARHIRPAAACL
jgi:magnesium-transporting ATPase (P-type)